MRENMCMICFYLYIWYLSNVVQSTQKSSLSKSNDIVLKYYFGKSGSDVNE